MTAYPGAPCCKTIFQLCWPWLQIFKVLYTTMSKHLLAIRDDHRTDIQDYTRTLPNSLPFFFTLSFFQSVRPSSLLFPSHPTTSCSPSQTYSHPTACSWFIPPSLLFCTWLLFEGVHFPQTLGGRGMLSRGCRQMLMFKTSLEALTSRRRQRVFSRRQCYLLQRSN